MPPLASFGHFRDPTSTGPVNAMTIDVEEYFQAQALEAAAPRASWRRRASRVEATTDLMLDLLAQAGVRATFFVLGWVARRHAPLLRRIATAGHEIASHGYAHRRVDRVAPASFRRDVALSRALLQDCTGQAVTGYRAPCFSIGRDEFWAYAALAEAGYAYSSSLYPIRHDLYGLPEAPPVPFRPETAPSLVEFPLPALRVAGHALPAGGGGVFRLLPYRASRWAIARINRREARPCIFYCHPWELDPGQPRLPGLSPRARWRHYLGLHRTQHRFARLLQDLTWDRLDSVMGEVLAKPDRLPIWGPTTP